MWAGWLVAGIILVGTFGLLLWLRHRDTVLVQAADGTAKVAEQLTEKVGALETQLEADRAKESARDAEEASKVTSHPDAVRFLRDSWVH